MKPVAYIGRTPHIHAKVKLGPTELLTTQLYVEGDPGNARDGLWRSLPPQDVIRKGAVCERDMRSQ
jgi:protocatechuate 3,4-dioxygenase beta subunit